MSGPGWDVEFVNENLDVVKITTFDDGVVTRTVWAMASSERHAYLIATALNFRSKS